MNLLKLGKYKGIIVSIALFLILDASVLLINFYISYEISADAVGVNIAGRQRMLSQRMMKSLLDAKVSEGKPEAALQELKTTSALFNATLLAFYNGGETKDAAGQPIILTPVTTKASMQAVSETLVIWKPYSEKITQLLAVPLEQLSSENFIARLDSAISIGQTSNLKLLKLMNDLTQDLENFASSKATKLRVIQTIGISLALVNFFIILFHFLRQLNDSDLKIEKARKETHEILATVNSGLFLIDKNLTMSNQHSNHLERIFGRNDFSNQSFDSILKELVSEKDLATTRNYINILFKPNIKEKLITDLNPLNQTEIRIQNNEGSYDSKYLNFSFSRVIETNNVSHILVTVSDISKEVKLAKQLDKEKLKNDKQLALLSSLLSVDTHTLPMYLDNCIKSLDKINEILKDKTKPETTYNRKIDHIFTIIHGIKGESATLGLDRFEEMSHEFEDELDKLKHQSNLRGKDFLHLTVLLNNFMSEIETSTQLSDKLNHFSGKNSTEKVTQAHHINQNWADFETLVKSTSIRQGKKIDFLHSGLNDRTLPNNLVAAINKISTQFIRNSIVHGIETPEVRKALKKSESGKINISLALKQDGEIQYSFHDDGAGINTDLIKSQAIKLGVISEEQSKIMGRKHLINLIFSPNFSSVDTANQDAGRGAGMNLVRSTIKNLGAKMTISTKVGLGTKFVITFPKQSYALTKVA